MSTFVPMSVSISLYMCKSRFWHMYHGNEIPEREEMYKDPFILKRQRLVHTNDVRWFWKFLDIHFFSVCLVHASEKQNPSIRWSFWSWLVLWLFVGFISMHFPTSEMHVIQPCEKYVVTGVLCFFPTLFLALFSLEGTEGWEPNSPQVSVWLCLQWWWSLQAGVQIRSSPVHTGYAKGRVRFRNVHVQFCIQFPVPDSLYVPNCEVSCCQFEAEHKSLLFKAILFDY